MARLRAGIRAGQRYGYRVYGAYDPSRGLRHNPAKLLVDPYARTSRARSIIAPTSSERRRTAPWTGVTARPASPQRGAPTRASTGRGDRAPRRAVARHHHLRGPREGALTGCTPRCPPRCGARTSGSRASRSLAHLKNLGVTALELLPVHECVDEPPVVKRGLTNYWGYSHARLLRPRSALRRRAGGDAGPRVQRNGRALHAAGHRGHPGRRLQPYLRGRHTGPTVSLRGIDNLIYYQLKARRRPASTRT